MCGLYHKNSWYSLYIPVHLQQQQLQYKQVSRKAVWVRVVFMIPPKFHTAVLPLSTAFVLPPQAEEFHVQLFTGCRISVQIKREYRSLCQTQPLQECCRQSGLILIYRKVHQWEHSLFRGVNVAELVYHWSCQTCFSPLTGPSKHILCMDFVNINRSVQELPL